MSITDKMTRCRGEFASYSDEAMTWGRGHKHNKHNYRLREDLEETHLHKGCQTPWIRHLIDLLFNEVQHQKNT